MHLSAVNTKETACTVNVIITLWKITLKITIIGNACALHCSKLSMILMLCSKIETSIKVYLLS